MATPAEAFAVAAHGNQRYAGGSYRDHLAAVVRVLREFGYAGPYEAAGWLHDVVEDTPVELATIADRFGPDIATMVDAVTGLGATRAERNEQAGSSLSAVRNCATSSQHAYDSVTCPVEPENAAGITVTPQKAGEPLSSNPDHEFVMIKALSRQSVL